MRLHKVPAVAQWIFSGLTWRKPGNEPLLYLTFDDGPIPEVTHFVLDQLANFKAKATFFCVGDNLKKYPAIAQKALSQGHRLANHTFNHLNGWKTSEQEYLANVTLCQQQLNKVKPAATGLPLFRPPYGKLTRAQAHALQTEYEIVMWDVLTYDFDAGMQPEQVLQQSIKHTQNGSVILFHDSLKAFRNMEYALPRFLEHFSSQGYSFTTL